ncbi:MAG: TonB family protein [Nitrospiraceae bacterium]
MSLLLHGAVVSLALLAVAEVKFVPDQNVFRWEVAVVQTPMQDTSAATAAVEPQPPATPASKPAPAKVSPPVDPPKPNVTRRIETKPVVETIRPERQPLAATPLERQVVERKVEQAQPVSQAIASRLETVTPLPVETPVAREQTHVIQERREVEDKPMPVATHTPQEVATVQKQEPVTSTAPQEAPPPTQEGVTQEVTSVPSPQPVAKNVSPIDEPAPARVAPEPLSQTAAVESPPAVTREVSPIVKENPPAESPPPAVARAEPTPRVETPSPKHENPADSSREYAPATTTVTKAYAAPRADFGWLTQALWRRIEQLKRYPHTARMNRWEGTVVVRCVIRPDGNFSELTMEKSSGHDILDADALELLRKASPLMLKHELGRPALTIRIPISYKLE